MIRLFLVLVFLIPFQARFYKCLRSVSSTWIDPSWHLPPYFETFADFFISDLILLILVLWALFQKKLVIRDQSFLTAFLGIALLSIVISEYRLYLLPYWRWAHLAAAALLVYALRSWKIHLKTIATVVVLSAVLECGIATTQYLMQHQVGLKIAGEQALISKHAAPAHFYMPKNAVTSIDYLLKETSGSYKIIRAYGTLPHPNILGCFLVFSLLMTCFLYEQSSKKGWLSAALILQIITLFMTYSRAGLFAFGGAAILWMLLHLFQEKKFSTLWKPLLIGIAASVFLFFPQLFHRGGVVSYNTVASQSDQMRLSMQEVAMMMIKDHPWFGVGFNNYLIAMEKYSHTAGIDSILVHNIYLLIAAETGMVGLAFFLLFCAAALYRGWQQRVLQEGRILLTLFLALLAIGAVDYHPVVFQQMRLIFFLTAGLLFSYPYFQVLIRVSKNPTI